MLGLLPALVLASVAAGVGSAAEAASATQATTALGTLQQDPTASSVSRDRLLSLTQATPPPFIGPDSPAAPVNTALPTVFGTAMDGQTLSSTTGAWVGTPTVVYIDQWRRCDGEGSNCIDIEGATRAAYTLAPADVGATLRLAVAAINAAGELTVDSAASAPVAAAPSLNTALPNISGVTTDGQTLRSATGTWTGTPTITYKRQWRRCDSAGSNCTDIDGATRATYSLTGEDVGATIRVVVTASNAAPGTASATSAQTAVVAATVPAAAFTTASGPQAGWVSWGSDIGGPLGNGFASFTPQGPTPLTVGGAKEIVLGHAALMPDGTVQAWGGNTQGEVGDGTLQRKLNPVTIPGLKNVMQVAGVAQHMVALLANGTVVTWGSNLFGQLGNGTDGGSTENCRVNCHSTAPVAVPDLAGVTAVFAGGADDLALLKNGTVVGWGENLKGQIGPGGKHDSPTLIPGLTNVKTLAIGGAATLGAHTLALLNNGTVKALGFNGEGQLGIGSTVSTSIPVMLPGITNATAISASWTHSLVLAGGKLYAFGNDLNGPLGVPTTTLCSKKPCATSPVQVPLKGVTSIAAGYAFSVAAAGGHAYSWGHDKFGELGYGGRGPNGLTPGLIAGLEGVTSVRAGWSSGIAMMSGALPPLPIEVIPGPGTLTVQWKAATDGTHWNVRSRKAACCTIKGTQPFGLITKLPAAARSYTLTGTPGQPYEVVVSQVGGTFGRDVVEGTPLP